MDLDEEQAILDEWEDKRPPKRTRESPRHHFSFVQQAHRRTDAQTLIHWADRCKKTKSESRASSMFGEISGSSGNCLCLRIQQHYCGQADGPIQATQVRDSDPRSYGKGACGSVVRVGNWLFVTTSAGKNRF